MLKLAQLILILFFSFNVFGVTLTKTKVGKIQIVTIDGFINQNEFQKVFDFLHGLNHALPTVFEFSSPGGYVTGFREINANLDDLYQKLAKSSKLRPAAYMSDNCQSACVPIYLSHYADLYLSPWANFGFHAASGGTEPEIETQYLKNYIEQFSGKEWMSQYGYYFDTTRMVNKSGIELYEQGFMALKDGGIGEEQYLESLHEVVENFEKRLDKSQSCVGKESGQLVIHPDQKVNFISSWSGPSYKYDWKKINLEKGKKIIVDILTDPVKDDQVRANTNSYVKVKLKAFKMLDKNSQAQKDQIVWVDFENIKCEPI